MASAITAVSFSLRIFPSLSTPSASASRGSVQFALFNKVNSLRLSSLHNVSGFGSFFPLLVSPISPSHLKLRSLTVVSAKGYKMKTHKASAKRFRVTGTGKIVRRRSGKQHLLAKKNTKRKLRLSKMIGGSYIPPRWWVVHFTSPDHELKKMHSSWKNMHPVNRSDYDNVIGALPYLKVNRNSQ